MRIAVYGAGGVGGYFGGRLAQAGAEVHLITRGAHLQALREHGLRVRSVKGDFGVQALATDDRADIGPCDFVLFCVKTFDTDAAATTGLAARTANAVADSYIAFVDANITPGQPGGLVLERAVGATGTPLPARLLVPGGLGALLGALIGAITALMFHRSNRHSRI
jgi:ketopantoate reductase